MAKKKLIEPVKVSRLWVNDPRTGLSSVSVTLLVVAFFIVCCSFILSMFETIGPVSLRAFDVAAAASLLTPLIALYFGRRNTDAKYNSPPNGDIAKGDE